MNRGHGGDQVFAGDSLKRIYLEILGVASKAFRIPIFAYCVMDNHFHLVVQNANGQFSRFMKVVQTRYAIRYRLRAGGQGYVFQDRFKSTVIQDDAYLMKAILYVLNNPVRAGIASSATEYAWSSAGEYFGDKPCEWLDHGFVEEFFSGKRAFMSALRMSKGLGLPDFKSQYGPVLGDESFVKQAEARYDRRLEKVSPRNARADDLSFEPVEKVIQEFECRISKPIEKITIGCHEGKRQRAELLVLLKDRAGLTYREIMEFDVFRGLAYSSLGCIYANARKAMKAGRV